MTDQSEHQDTHDSLFMDTSYETLAEWEQDGYRLGKRKTLLQIHIGQWLQAGNQKWGNKYEHAQAILGLSYDTLAQYVSVVENVPARVLQMAVEHPDILTYSHLRRLKSRPKADQIQLAERCIERNWTDEDLKFYMDEDSDDDSPFDDVVYRTMLRQVYDMGPGKRRATRRALDHVERNPNGAPEPVATQEHTATVGGGGTATTVSTRTVVCPECEAEFEIET